MSSCSIKGGKIKSLKTKRTLKTKRSLKTKQTLKTKRRLSKKNKKSVKGGSSPKKNSPTKENKIKDVKDHLKKILKELVNDLEHYNINHSYDEDFLNEINETDNNKVLDSLADNIIRLDIRLTQNEKHLLYSLNDYDEIKLKKNLYTKKFIHFYEL
jgi:hypothetical protein